MKQTNIQAPKCAVSGIGAPTDEPEQSLMIKFIGNTSSAIAFDYPAVNFIVVRSKIPPTRPEFPQRFFINKVKITDLQLVNERKLLRQRFVKMFKISLQEFRPQNGIQFDILNQKQSLDGQFKALPLMKRMKLTTGPEHKMKRQIIYQIQQCQNRRNDYNVMRQNQSKIAQAKRQIGVISYELISLTKQLRLNQKYTREAICMMKLQSERYYQHKFRCLAQRRRKYSVEIRRAVWKLGGIEAQAEGEIARA